MSIIQGKIKIADEQKRGVIILAFFTLIEFILTVFLVISFSANTLFPNQTGAAAGVPAILSYQGRLTNASGDPLGGAGTNYCFRFSIYDAVSGGSKIWPSTAPLTMTVPVSNGIFNVGIGDTGAGGDDLSVFNSYATSTIFLNVEVASQISQSCSGVSFDTLAPRQRVDAISYAQASRDVYGSLLRTLNASSTVQIGTRIGSPTVLFALDIKNTSDTIGGACSTAGTLWYNSNISRALICDAGGTIQEIGNLGTIVGIKEASAGSAISSGTVNFSGINGISVAQNGQTLSISGLNAFGVSTSGNTAGDTGTRTGAIVFVGSNNITLNQSTGAGVNTIFISGAGGGGGATLSYYEPYPAVSTALMGIPIVTSAVVSVYPFDVVQNVSAGVMNLMASVGFLTVGASSGRQTAGLMAGIYTRGVGVNSTTIGVLTSAALSWQVTGNNSSYSINQVTQTNYAGYGATAQTNSAGVNISSGYTGVKMIGIPINSLLTPGPYWLAVMGTKSTSSVNVGVSMSLYMGIRNTAQTAMGPFGSFSSFYSLGNNAFGGRWQVGLGSWTSAGSVTGLPVSMAFTSISAGNTQNPLIRFWST